mgnify:CR=1 FL=1
MKTILEGFRGYIHEAEFSEYSKGGNVILYHYMKKPRIGEETEDTVLIDPKYFADPKTRSSYSRNEYEVSTARFSMKFRATQQTKSMIWEQIQKDIKKQLHILFMVWEKG